MAERIAWIDFAKGVAIILVALGHCKVGDSQKFIYVFHMPFFFVTAGFLLNLNKWGGAENFNAFAAKLFKRLLVPYYIAEFLFYPIWFVVCHKMGLLNYLQRWPEINPFYAFTAIFIGNGNDIGLLLGQMWFLPALLCAELIFVELFNWLGKFGMKIFTLAIMIFTYVGFNVTNPNFLPFGFDIALAAQIFLLAGVLIRKYNVVERMDLRTCAALTLLLVFAFNFNVHVVMTFRIYGNPFLFYAGGLAGTLLVMKLSALTTGGKIFSLISSCGRQSMMILVLHLIIANVFYEVLAQATDIPPEIFFTDSAVICASTVLGVLIPLWIAKRFGKLPVLKYFCA